MVKELQMPLSNVQVELLKLYSTNLSEEDLLDLRTMIARYYAERAIKNADKIWNERGLTNDDMEKLLNDENKSCNDSRI